MKVRDTSQGRMYAVSSNPGCTVINGDMAVDVPAGGQSVILALDKKLIIDGDDDAKFVEVRWGTNAAVGSRPAPSWIGDVVDGLTSIVGEGKFDANYIPIENKLYLQFSLEVTNEQITEVKALLKRVLPEDLALAVEWENGLPIDYTPVEWIEAVSGQYIQLPFSFNTAESRVSVETTHLATRFPSPSYQNEGCGEQIFWGTMNYNGKTYISLWNYSGGPAAAAVDANFVYGNWYRHRYEVDDTIFTTILSDGTRKSITARTAKGLYMSMFRASPYNVFPGRKKTFRLWNGSKIAYNCIPALSQEGQPCMFDLVSETAFTNAGSGDFTYPSPTSSTTYSLRRPVAEWGKLTPHGVRRLYKLPDNYTGDPEQYIAENGFKRLVETEKPEEGYWVPVWHDREDRIELEWVETEPPTEEELQIEEIENA